MSIKLGSSLLAGNLDKNMYPSKDEMNELFSSSVKLDGDQDINGVKTFNDNLYAPNQLDYSKITNCITEIPQDIKLELNNGTLTLKTSSKVYVPNGFEADGTTPKFDVVVINNDLTYSYGYNDTRPLMVNAGGTIIDGYPVAQTFSGPTAPTGITYMFWYDTTTNIIKETHDSGVTWSSTKYSFPFCIIKGGSDIVESINQIFNGLGYIGSTVFALPGVKGLISDGRNKDGSLKNIEFTIDKVKTNTNTSSYDNQWIFYDGNNLQDRGMNNIRYYDENENKWFISNGYYSYCLLFTIKRNNGVITSFTSKLPFRAVDYNDAVSSIQNISSTSGTVSLLANNVYKMSLSGATTFSLTTPTNMAILNQIEVQINMSSVQTINLGTTRYFGGSAPDLSESGAYTLIYEYDTVNNVWVVGALRKAVG